jgi:hypothetical protein
MPDETMIADDDAREAQDVAAQTDQQASDDVSALQSALRKEREQRRALDKERKALLAKMADIESAGKPEAERIAAERDALKAELDSVRGRERQARAKASVLGVATDAGAVNAGVVYRAILNDITFDDDGEPTNIPSLIAGLKKEVPAMFRQVVGKADATTGATQATANGDWIKRGLNGRRG